MFLDGLNLGGEHTFWQNKFGDNESLLLLHYATNAFTVAVMVILIASPIPLKQHQPKTYPNDLNNIMVCYTR